MKGELRTDLTGLANTPLVVAAHELKDPLILLRQLAYSLADDSLSQSMREEIAMHMTIVSEQALRLTSDITRASRLQDSLFDVETLNPLAICSEVVRDSLPLYAAHGREIELRARRPAVLVSAHRDLLRRSLLNLTDNALRHTDNIKPVRMTVGHIRQTNSVRISVRDHGPALPLKVWQQLNSQTITPMSMSTRPGSSGLGLAISMAFVRAMGGRIGAIRHRDGATLYIDLPQSRQLCLL